MGRSIRFPIWVLNGLKHKQSPVKGFSQISGACLGASQVGNYNGFTSSLTRSGHGAANNQANVYQSQHMAEGRSGLESNNGPALAGNSKNIGANPNSGLYDAGFGFLTHDGSYKMFRWDNAKGCMVPFESSTSLVRRFQRSVAAFLTQWRHK